VDMQKVMAVLMMYEYTSFTFVREQMVCFRTNTL